MGGLFIIAMLPLLIIAMIAALLILVAGGLMKLAFALAILCAIGLIATWIYLSKKGTLAQLKESPKRWQQACGRALPIVICIGIACCIVFAIGDLIAFTLFDQWVNNYLLAPAD